MKRVDLTARLRPASGAFCSVIAVALLPVALVLLMATRGPTPRTTTALPMIETSSSAISAIVMIRIFTGGPFFCPWNLGFPRLNVRLSRKCRLIKPMRDC